MESTVIKTNEVKVDGIVYTAPRFSHAVLGEKFYTFDLAVRRKSGVMDYIPVTVSDRAFDIDSIEAGTSLAVLGSFRSYNKHTQNGSRLLLSVFASELSTPAEQADENKILLQGTVCKVPQHRTTPLGREIADLFLAVNRSYGKSDYIPCIVWGRNAIYAGKIPVGTKFNCRGRIQSRVYKKDNREHTVYEVSLYSLEPVG
ncbi:MAG: single-stranded DNA-binding protein [Clostridiales bacterium]|nr:single-stranded DNA-binding protein [Clostridiales bacterium]